MKRGMLAAVIDWAVGSIDPVRGAQRVAARARADAIGALSQSLSIGASASGEMPAGAPADGFLRRWAVMPRDSAGDTLFGLPNQRAQARDLVRTNPIAASAINTNVVRAIGTGLAYSAQPHLQTLGWTPEQGERWRTHVQAEFSLWADSRDCDWRGEQNFYEIQDLTLRSMLESGDVFTVLPDAPERTPGMPYALRLQTIEADRVGNPISKLDSAEMAGGVRRSSAGPVEAYHFYGAHPGTAGLARAYEGKWIAARGASGRRRVLHHYVTLRPEQPRGVPYLAPVMSLFKLLGTYTDAEVKAAVVSAFLTLIIETPTGAGVPPVFGLADAASGQAPGAGQGIPGGAYGDEMQMGPGAVLGLAAGEKANAITPGRPNPAFGDFVQAVYDQIGAGTYIGSEMLMKRYNTSYVAARAAFLDAWKHLLGLRTLVARSLCQPVLETWMADAVSIGRVEAPGFFADPRLRWAYTRAGWQGDSQGSINPKDEVAAFTAAVDARLLTRERAEWELFGSDWRDTYGTKLAEQRRMADDGILPAPRPGAPVPHPTQEGG